VSVPIELRQLRISLRLPRSCISAGRRGVCICRSRRRRGRSVTWRETFPRHQRRGVRVGATDELVYRIARDPGRARPNDRSGVRIDREHRVRQLVLSARRRHHRLWSGQSRGGEPQQVALPGVRSEGHRRELHLAAAR
jgi:hypothetical protein